MLEEEIDKFRCASLTDNVVESAMRIRAMTELSTALNTEALIALAGIAEQQCSAIYRFVADFDES